MKWKKLSEELPKKGKTVLIWRKIRKKYSIAHIELFSTHENEELEDTTICEEGMYYGWVTQQSCVHQAEVGDYWMEFPYLTAEIEYK